MLIKATEVVGWPIQDKRGNQMAKVADTVFANPQGRLIGLVTEDKQFVDRRYIQEIGDGCFTLSKPWENIKKPIKESALEKKSLGKDILGTAFIDSKGEPMGKVGDVLFQANQLQIVKYEISDGLLKDLVKGRQLMESKEVVHDKGKGNFVVSNQKESE